MATETPRTEYVDPTPDPESVIDTARRHGLAIECTGASGVTHSFIHAVDGLWAARCELQSGQSETWVTNPDREETIVNCIMRCQPDVRLVEESCSAFGGDSDDA